MTTYLADGGGTGAVILGIALVVLVFAVAAFQLTL